ncbi:MAG: 3-dehydroquinate synthase [Solirubrobacterales bacterium]|nr:3-dehydroquinate synthase [Solirubrobacterales bacterium]
MALVLIGFMGAGKSTLARRRGGVDTDEMLGEPAEALFDRVGEEAFRDREEQAVLEALGSGAGVIALGGGATGSARVRAALADHTVAWLEVDLETAWERASGQGRPLARDRETFGTRFAERQAIYEELADVFVLPGGELGDELPGPGEKLICSPVHPVWVGRGVTPREGDFTVSDEHVAPLHAPHAFVVPAGEERKTLQTAEGVWREMARQGITRSGRVVAVGGGVVGDLAGFCAATYQRGIPVVQVPTTLVAQVDSAYGGKTGVDLPEAKNYGGAYHQPETVHVLPETLATLPAAERAAGYAEVVKTGLIAGGSLWERVRGGAVDDPATVLACARTKLAIVAADERDGGIRQVLNLGHTVGHAIETVTGYGRYRHGEAVGLGLLAALRLSGQDALRADVGRLLAGQGLPTTLEGADPAAVADATRRDKKRTGAATPFVLVEAPGRVTGGHAVPEADLLAAVQELAA